jgi:hypothetical protein
MGVDIDPAWRHDMVGRIDLTPARAKVRAHRNDAVSIDRHVGFPGGCPGSINDAPTTNHQIMHTRLLYSGLHSAELT